MSKIFPSTEKMRSQIQLAKAKSRQELEKTLQVAEKHIEVQARKEEHEEKKEEEAVAKPTVVVETQDQLATKVDVELQRLLVQYGQTMDLHRQLEEKMAVTEELKSKLESENAALKRQIDGKISEETVRSADLEFKLKQAESNVEKLTEREKELLAKLATSEEAVKSLNAQLQTAHELTQRHVALQEKHAALKERFAKQEEQMKKIDVLEDELQQQLLLNLQKEEERHVKRQTKLGKIQIAEGRHALLESEILAKDKELVAKDLLLNQQQQEIHELEFLVGKCGTVVKALENNSLKTERKMENLLRHSEKFATAHNPKIAKALEKIRVFKEELENDEERLARKF